MVPMALSSGVTLLTAAACFFLARNLNEADFISDPTDNARLTEQILAEVEEPNVADYRVLEDRIEEQLQPAEEVAAVEDEEEEKVSEKDKDTASSSSPSDSPTNGKEENISDSTSSESAAELKAQPEKEAHQPDLVIEASHLLKNSGQHRAYSLSLHFNPRSRLEAEHAVPWTRCNLRMEWPLPRNVFVDVWSLRRQSAKSSASRRAVEDSASTIVPSQPVWQVKPRHPDIEAGAYDQTRAKPFLLIADVAFSELGPSPFVKDGRLLDVDAPWRMDLQVPDLVVRYQAAQDSGANFLAQLTSPRFYLPPPSLQFTCDQESSHAGDVNVQWRLDHLRPLELSLPVGAASPVVGQFTIGTITTAALLLITLLLKQ